MSKKTDDFYDCFSVFYPLVDVFLRPQKRKLFREINKHEPGKLLEIGVGNGHHLSLYRRHQVIGIDTSGTMLAIAGKRKPANIELLQMNGESLHFRDETFDYVVLSHVLAVVDKPDKLLTEIYRVLKPGGKVFILNHFTPNNWLRYFDKSIKMLSNAFHFRSVFYIESLTALGKFSLVQEINLDRLSYFKILIFYKA